MLVYIIMTILCFALLNFSKRVEKNWQKKLLLFFAFLTIFFVSALRVNVGTDYKSYQNWFYSTNKLNLSYTNIGFNFLIIILKIFTNNPQWLFVILSFIILGIVFITNIKNYKDYDMTIFLFITLGFFFSSMNGIRQWVAVAIFMYSYKYIINKDFKKYCPLIIIASLFHVTAILLIPMYFIINYKINDKSKIIILIVSLLIFKIFDIYGLLSFVLKYFAPQFYWRYIESGADIGRNVGSPFPILLCSGMFIYYIVFKKQFLKKMANEEYEQHKHLSFILSFFAILNTVNNLFSRFALYFIPMIIFLLPDVYLIIDKKYVKWIKLAILVVGIAYMTINTLLKNSNGPLPYDSVFSYIFN